jgi:hypothetical protein
VKCPGVHCPGCKSSSGIANSVGAVAALCLAAYVAAAVLGYIAARIWWIAGAGVGIVVLAGLFVKYMERFMLSGYTPARRRVFAASVRVPVAEPAVHVITSVPARPAAVARPALPALPVPAKAVLGRPAKSWLGE